MNLDKETQSALTHAKDALDERDKIGKAITAAEAELASAKAELPKIRTEFARDRVAVIIGSKSNRPAKAHTTVAAARERIEELEDELEGLRLALVDQEDALLAAEEQLSGKVESLRNQALEAFVQRYREAFTSFYGVLKDGFALMAAFNVEMPALREMRVYEDPLGLRMAPLGAVSSSGTYCGLTASPEIVAEFSALRQTLDAAKREGRKIQERHQLAELKLQRERADRGEGRRSTTHYTPGPVDAEVA